MRVEGFQTRTAVLLIYALLLSLMARWVFAMDATIALVLYGALLLPLFAMLRWPNAPVLLFSGFAFMLVGKIVYAATVDPLAGPDEIHYFEQVTTFERLSDFLPYAMEHFRTQWMSMSAYPVYGLMYMPFYKWLELDNPLAIVLLNTVLLILIVNATYRLNESRFKYELPIAEKSTKPFHVIVAVGLLVSPSLMYMSSLFAKDIACVLLGLYCTMLMLRKRWLLFIVLMIYATGLRDYAIVYTLCFYFLYTQRIRAAAGLLAGAGLLIMWQIGPLGIINAGMLTVFLFISPNPSNLSNWDTHLLLRTLEATFMAIILAMSIFQFYKYKETRKFYMMAAILLFTYACSLVLVGYVTITGRELDYGVGTIGDNMVRKKLPVIPLIYTISAYTIIWCRRTFTFKHQKIQINESFKAPIKGENDYSSAEGGASHAGTR